MSKKLISLFLAFSLAVLSANLYAKERRGAKLIVTKKDGQLIEGELITVKPNSLLLLSITGRDMSVGISEIKVIKIVKKSKVWTGAGLGLLIGAGCGALIGYAGGGETRTFGWWTSQTTAGEEALGYGIVGGLVGGIIGGIFGVGAGKDETIQIEGKSPRWIEFYLEKLRKKARIPDYK